MTVAIVPATYRSAERDLQRALELLDYRPTRGALLIKPNLVLGTPWVPIGGASPEVVTHRRVVEALIRLLGDGREVVVADGPPEGVDMAALWRRHGYERLQRAYPRVRFLDLRDVERVEVPWAFGSLKLPALLRTHEYVNVPKLKTHSQTLVSLGVKNQKGLLTAADKRRFHLQLGLHPAVRALGEAVQPALTVVDAVRAMEGNGPANGRTRRPGLLLAGRDLFEVDAAGCALMGIDPAEVAHLKPTPVQTLGLGLDGAGPPFRRPTYLARIMASLAYADPSACSGCTVSLLAGVARAWTSPLRLAVVFVRGGLIGADILTGHPAALPPGGRRVLCYGRCARAFAHTHGLPLVDGCPPGPDGFYELFTRCWDEAGDQAATPTTALRR